MLLQSPTARNYSTGFPVIFSLHFFLVLKPGVFDHSLFLLCEQKQQEAPAHYL